MTAQERIALMLGRLIIEQEVKADEVAALRAELARQSGVQQKPSEVKE
jgi:hypothetical protein